MFLICYGTRPEFLKVKPLFPVLDDNRIPYKTLFTGQHKDIINDNTPDYTIEIKDGTNRLDSILSSCLNNDDIFKNIKYVMVQGDTTSALSLGLAAFHRKIKLIHLEAGLRTYDKENPYPEESNRQLLSRISDIHLCPTELNKKNLIKEKVSGEIFVVGNTSIDNLVGIQTESGDGVLITLHRRENHEIIKEWFFEINSLQQKYPGLRFVFPMHPNPNVQMWKHLLPDVEIVNPMTHSEILENLRKCKLVITDSGGIQEESSYLNKRTIVCRKETERQETIGTNSFLCKSPKKLQRLFKKMLYITDKKYECPYGQGDAAHKIAKILILLNI